MRTEIDFALGKSQGYIPSSIGGMSISVGKQAGRQVVSVWMSESETKIFTIRLLQPSKL